MMDANRKQPSNFNWRGHASDRWLGKPVLGGDKQEPVVHRVGRRPWQERE